MRYITRLVEVLVFSGLAVAAVLLVVHLYLNTPIRHATVELSIEKGYSLNEILRVLDEKGVIRCKTCFKAYAVLGGYALKIKAGDYEFGDGLSHKGVMKKLISGDFKRYMVTIPEGWRAIDIARMMEGKPFVGNAEVPSRFLELVSNPKGLGGLDIGWEVPSLEGYLFPSTYEIYKLRDPKDLIFRMVGEFRTRFSKKLLDASRYLHLSPHELVVLASIIEKETAVPDEKPLVASVFYNRLKKNMPLQSDPTVIYGLKDFDGNLKKADLLNPHPYNTYVHLGLPPTPICNPGKTSIEAAIHPASTDYLYFVSKNDGTHAFSSTLSEHERNVDIYQRKMR